MCGRFTLTKSQEEIEARFEARFKEWRSFRQWNAAPSNELPIITNLEKGAVQFYKWGLVPAWAKDEKMGYKTINARVETVSEKPAFRHAYRYQRCLVLADGYYEWKSYGKEKIPFRIIVGEGKLFAMAGLWEVWEKEGSTLRSFTILTRPALKPLAFIHDRMPIILEKEAERLWLLDDLPETNRKTQLDSIPDAQDFSYHTVSKEVNTTKENHPQLIQPFKHNIQGSLF